MTGREAAIEILQGKTMRQGRRKLWLYKAPMDPFASQVHYESDDKLLCGSVTLDSIADQDSFELEDP